MVKGVVKGEGVKHLLSVAVTMIVNQKGLFEFLNSVLAEYGFLRKKSNWYLETEECIVVFGCSKSYYSGQYAIIITTFLKVIDLSVKHPRPEKGHFLGLSLGNIVPKKKAFRDALNLDIAFDGMKREKVLRDSILKYGIPLMNLLGSSSGILLALNKYKTLDYHLTATLRDHLGVN